MPVFALVALLLLAGSPAGAAETVATSGVVENFGTVTFANSGAPAAQADFLAGLALLHDFEYPAAAEAFARAQTADPGFALAYWGEAMTFTHPIWMQQDATAARAVLARLAPTAELRRAKAPTEREKAYLDAVEVLYGQASASEPGKSDAGEPTAESVESEERAKEQRDRLYEAAMRKLRESYPEDVDAVAFHALSILGTAHAGRDVPTYMRAAGLLETAWTEHPDHPGLLHYLIHCYDDPAHAPLGLRAARRYAQIAPDAGHAIHMTSHIFLALGMWKETVETNVAAIAAVNRMRTAKGKGPARCGHYTAWLGYAHLQLGELEPAKAVLTACREAALEEKAATGPGHSMDPDFTLGGAFANLRLSYLIESGDWQSEVASWPLPPVAPPGARLDFAFARALGAISRGTPEEIRLAMADLEAVGREVTAAETAKYDPNPSFRLRPEIFKLEAQALLAEKQGDFDGSEKLLRQAIAVGASLPVDFGPPMIDLPIHELLGEFLLRRGRKEEARVEFELALDMAPGRRLARRGLDAASTTTAVSALAVNGSSGATSTRR